MLKKLVKYGNSQALVLDRTILSLLNISEDSLLRLRVEGETLIIRGEKAAKPIEELKAGVESLYQNIKMSGNSSQLNALVDASESEFYKQCDRRKKEPGYNEPLKEWLPGTANANKLQKAYEKIMANYKEEMEALARTKPFQDEMEELSKSFKGDISSKEFVEEMQAIRLKYAPGLAKMDQEMESVAKELGAPDKLL